MANQYSGSPGPRKNQNSSSFGGLQHEGSNLKRKKRPEFKVPTAGSVSPGDIYYAEPREIEVTDTPQRKLGDKVSYSNEESVQVDADKAATSDQPLTPKQVAEFVSGEIASDSNPTREIGISVGHADPARLDALLEEAQPADDATEDDDPDLVTTLDDAGMIADASTETEDDDSDS